MVSRVRSLGLHGIGGYEVSCECFLSNGLPGFEVVTCPFCWVYSSAPVI